jgi:TRAP-type mannitol/chloroaromatic compound transport system permease large subunit
VLFGLLLIYYYLRFDEEQFEILKLLIESVMPLGVLTLLVLAVILLGITTATESAAVGALGAFILALQAGTLDFERTKQAVFLTAKTTSMVCWLFVGSALFSAVFTILGGQSIIEKWVLMLDLTPIQFMLLSQAIIFFLPWSGLKLLLFSCRSSCLCWLTSISIHSCGEHWCLSTCKQRSCHHQLQCLPSI